jgi:hypothetical protein
MTNHTSFSAAEATESLLVVSVNLQMKRTNNSKLHFIAINF